MSVKSFFLSALCLLHILTFPAVNSFAKDETATETERTELNSANKKLVRVSTLNSVKANQEFQQNVQVLQAQRQRAIELQYQLEVAQSENLKANLKEELDLALKKLAESNKKMTESYGFSLAREYVLVVEKAHIYMAVSEEELNQIKEEQSEKKPGNDNE